MTNQTIRNENSNQCFYMFPKALFQKPYSDLSLNAKMLYVMLLDRCRLSEKTGFKDQNGRTYIYYTIKEISSQLSCSTAHAVKLLGELDNVSGAGLIERKKQGQGKPCMIYVNMLSYDKIDEESLCEEVADSENQSNFLPVSDIKEEEFLSDEFNDDEFRTSTEFNSGVYENVIQDFNSVESINNDKNNNNINNNNSIISNQIISESDMIEMIEKNNSIKEIVKDNIDYEAAVYNLGENWVNGIVELITDVVCSNQKTIRINRQDYPQELVAERFLNLNYSHIENVYMTMNTVTTSPSNIRAYMITALYRSYETADYWVTVKARSDLARERMRM